MALLVGCSGPKDAPEAHNSEQSGKPQPEAAARIDPATVEGVYIGTLSGPEDPETSPLPPSIREVVGDAQLTLKADRFTLTHKGLALEGPYRVEDGMLLLSVETVDGLTRAELDKVDLAANKKAGKEPSTEEMLAFYREVFTLTDWRFKAAEGGFEQVAQGASAPTYRFKRKES
jgi:hypothetical protein